MNFLREKKLYKVEITDKCDVKGLNYFLKILMAVFITDGTAVICPPNMDIPIGTTGRSSDLGLLTSGEESTFYHKTTLKHRILC